MTDRPVTSAPSCRPFFFYLSSSSQCGQALRRSLTRYEIPRPPTAFLSLETFKCSRCRADGRSVTSGVLPNFGCSAGALGAVCWHSHSPPKSYDPRHGGALGSGCSLPVPCFAFLGLAASRAEPLKRRVRFPANLNALEWRRDTVCDDPTS